MFPSNVSAMKNTKPLPSLQVLNECFTYDPENGKLFWRVRPLSHFKTKRGQSICNALFAGTIAGHEHYDTMGRPSGVQVGISLLESYKVFYAHRIIYAMMTGGIPEDMEVDHRDLNPFRNCWTNLRLATAGQNMANQPVRRERKHKLPKGVHPRSNGKFIAKIGRHGKSVHVGTFNTAEEANAAYLSKATEFNGSFARGN